ncbi:DMT family transporter [Falsihalocynthiibacter sp. SS001]|uniref:DMT family transporter n=1 Tax=Falsihalocynthiibacter sp. SS001 TaxID=3349698 RepID=UPI0036D29A35
MTQDRPLLGIILIIGFCFLAPLGDAMAKLLGAANGLVELAAYRFIIQTIIVIPIIIIGGRSLRTSPRIIGLSFLRALLHISATIMLFLTLRYMPLADTLAIVFVMPFIMMFLGWYFLKEEVGPRRIIAACVGFAGTLLVIQPSFMAVGAFAFVPIGVAVTFALFMLVTRLIAKEVGAMELQAMNGIAGVIILVPVWFLGSWLGWPEFQMTGASDNNWTIILLMGCIGTLAHLLMTWSLRFAPSSTLAPMQYLEIPIATVYGYFLFGDLPNGIAAIGIAIVIGAGLYVVYRESRQARITQLQV